MNTIDKIQKLTFQMFGGETHIQDIVAARCLQSVGMQHNKALSTWQPIQRLTWYVTIDGISVPVTFVKPTKGKLSIMQEHRFREDGVIHFGDEQKEYGYDVSIRLYGLSDVHGRTRPAYIFVNMQ